MWLFPELMRLLRPIVLERARPGTRVLTSTWSLGDWKPDEIDESEGPAVYKWIVPARVEGRWQWNLEVAGRRFRYASVLDQHFQEVEGVARAGDRREVLEDVQLRGDDLRFTLAITLDGLGLTRHEFAGTVRANDIRGTVTLTPSDQSARSVSWEARRSDRSDYFAPTGLELFAAPASP
jgi:hypothetical protein